MLALLGVVSISGLGVDLSEPATLAERASDLGYAAGWMAVRALPDQVARGLFNAGADVAWRRMGDNAQLPAELEGHLPGDVRRWSTEEPSERGLQGAERMAALRDEIDGRVQALADELR